jgi:Leucine-rich repeat (LRR) protein
VNLEDLNLSRNKINLIPESLYLLTKIKILIMNYNCIKNINKKISNLTELKFLDLGNNKISLIPESFYSLRNLSEVSFCSNQISFISDKIIELSILNMDVFNIYNNKIVSIEKKIIKEFKCYNFHYDKNIILT